MCLDGAYGKEQARCYLGIAVALGEQLQYLVLAVGEVQLFKLGFIDSKIFRRIHKNLLLNYHGFNFRFGHLIGYPDTEQRKEECKQTNVNIEGVVCNEIFPLKPLQKKHKHCHGQSINNNVTGMLKNPFCNRHQLLSVIKNAS